MMTAKFSPIVAILLLAGAGAAAPSAAQATEAHAASLDPAFITPMHVRCYMGMTTDRPGAFDHLHRGWFCIPEVAAPLTH
jgi:hypothetical protein